MSDETGPEPFRIGVHPNNLHLRLARAVAELEGSPFAFVAYPDGRSTGALLESGAIHLGGTGSTPPLTAQAGGLDVVYVAASAPRPANGAILVHAGNPVTSLPDLPGATVALVEGSFHTYLLAHLAEQAGLPLAAFRRLDLPPRVSAAALRDGRVDAWIAMDPHLAGELAKGGLAVVPGSQGVIPNRSLIWTTAAVAAAHPGAIVAARALLDRVAVFATEHAVEAARHLAADGEASEADWRAVLASRDWRVVDAGPDVLAEQKAEAVCLRRHGALAGSIDPVAFVAPLSDAAADPPSPRAVA